MTSTPSFYKKAVSIRQEYKKTIPENEKWQLYYPYPKDIQKQLERLFFYKL